MFIFSGCLYISYHALLYTENIFFQTAYDTEAEKRKASASTSNLHSNKAFSGNSSSGDKWILMTRAHFTEAIVAVAISKKLGDTVRKFCA